MKAFVFHTRMTSITRTEIAREKRIACASMVQTIRTSSGKKSQPNPRSMVAERTMLPSIQEEDSGRESVDSGRSGCPRERECSVIPRSMTTAFVSAVQRRDRMRLKRQTLLAGLRPPVRDLTLCNAVLEEAAPQHFPQHPKVTASFGQQSHRRRNGTAGSKSQSHAGQPAL